MRRGSVLITRFKLPAPRMWEEGGGCSRGRGMGTERECKAGNAIIAFCEISAVARGCVSVELRVTFMGESFIDSRIVARHFKRRVAINVYIWPLPDPRTIYFRATLFVRCDIRIWAEAGKHRAGRERQKRPAKIPPL